MFDSVVLGEYLISVAHKNRIILNVTQVQKILYIIYGVWLASKDELVSKESPKCWPYGPVFPRTRNKVDFKNALPLSHNTFTDLKKNKELVLFMEDVVVKLAQVSASKLSEWSHQVDSPWYRTTKHDRFKWGDEIPNSYIKEYFSSDEEVLA